MTTIAIMEQVAGACGLLLMATIAIGCAGMAGAEREETSSPDPVLSMLNKGILQLA